MTRFLKLFKPAVRVVQYKDRVKLHLPSACPVKGLLLRITELLSLARPHRLEVEATSHFQNNYAMLAPSRRLVVSGVRKSAISVIANATHSCLDWSSPSLDQVELLKK